MMKLTFPKINLFNLIAAPGISVDHPVLSKYLSRCCVDVKSIDGISLDEARSLLAEKDQSAPRPLSLLSEVLGRDNAEKYVKWVRQQRSTGYGADSLEYMTEHGFIDGGTLLTVITTARDRILLVGDVEDIRRVFQDSNIKLQNNSPSTFVGDVSLVPLKVLGCL